MPKGKIEEMVGNKRVRRVIRRSHKIGGRKSTRSAHQMTNDELRKIAASDRTRDAQVARNELVRRHVPVEFTEDVAI